MNQTKVRILAGIRTAFARSGGVLADRHAEDLGVLAARELLCRTGVDPDRLDGVVTGNVGQSARAANISRVIALRAGIPDHVPAVTVHRNCASGFEAVTTCAQEIRTGRGRLYLAIGCESMSNYPLELNDEARALMMRLGKARSLAARLAALASFRPAMLRPVVTLLKGLRDPVVGLNMGETAELLAREWDISREEQDAFARESHRKALEGRDRLREETFDVVTQKGVLRDDDGVRTEEKLTRLESLRPVFARAHGSVTAGNSSQITDGAVALLVGTEEMEGTFGLNPLGELVGHAYVGCDPARMGLGPVHAIHALFEDRHPPLEEIDLFEINEAFAAQVLACLRAMENEQWCRDHLGRNQPLGTLPRERLNVNGGAVALGHPVGASGARLVLTALMELRRRRGKTALVSLCVGGGQGGALLLQAP